MASKNSVLITGCSQGGIGSALAIEFQKRGLHVFATARTLEKMTHLKDLPNVTFICLDVTDQASVTAASEQVRVATRGKLDYLVNNSGTQHIAPVIDTDIQIAKEMFRVNVFGVLLMVKSFSPLLLAARGCIVNICSVSSYVYAPWMGLYQASKAATEMLSETMRLELQPLGIRVISLVTGAVATNIMTGASVADLPESSPYKVRSVEDAIAKMTSINDGIKRTPADEYAKLVVNDTLAGSSGRIWRGQMAGLVSFMSKFIPASIIVSPSRFQFFFKKRLTFVLGQDTSRKSRRGGPR